MRNMMKILFNLVDTGLSNNGGSKTLIESANILQELNNEVIIVDSGKNYNTWNPIKCNHIIINKLKENFPLGDVIIATGIKSVSSTNKSLIKNKLHWIRGWEVWNLSEKELVQQLEMSPTIKIVNSICLKNKLKSYGIESTIIRPGHNFDEIYPINIRKNNKKIILGGLYNEGKKRQTKRTSWIFDCYNYLKTKYPIELYMFGSDGNAPKIVNNYFKNPDIKTKNELYNKIDIWLSPSELEGLHIPPAEAMLTECCVVGNSSLMNGTEDYLINNETGLISRNNINSFTSTVESLINNKELREELGKFGRQKILSLGDRKDNMKKMVSFLKENFK